MDVLFDFISERDLHFRFNYEMQRLIDALYDSYGVVFDKRICVAVSGGADSLCLLLLLSVWAQNHEYKLFCVTVDHKLRNESAEEAKFVATICEQMGIIHKVLCWNHEDTFAHGKLEKIAREARYNLITNFCNEENIKIVCTAHNWDDQIETHVMRSLFRSTESGLAGMSQMRKLSHDVVLLRPVMHFSKKCLMNLLMQKKIVWKHDIMNDDMDFLRVKIRKQIATWSMNKKNIVSNRIVSLRDKRYQIEKNAVCFLQNKVIFFREGFVEIPRANLDIDTDVLCEVLKRLVWDVGGKEYATSISTSFISSIFDSKKVTIGRSVISINSKCMRICRENRNIPLLNLTNCDMLWDNRFKISSKSIQAIYSMNYESLKDNNFILTESEISSVRDLPADAVKGLPRFLWNGKMCFMLSNYEFIHKLNLFDIFF